MSNQGGVYTWSKTAGNNASADSTVNWLEGQAPSSINDSARGMMASVAKWRDDISGAIVTTGSSAAYSVSSNQNFDSLVDFVNQVIAFSPHTTNAAGPVTMTVDGFANLPLRSSPGVELQAGILIQGTPYLATYNNTDHALYLHSFFGASPYLIPLGASLEFWGTTAPNSSFAFPFGQAISRTTYAPLFALVSTTYGVGDGSTTFNLPDCRGRVVAGKDNMGGTGAGRLQAPNGGIDGTILGNAGGADSHTLTAAEMPVHSHPNSLTDPGHSHFLASLQASVATGGGFVAPRMNSGNDNSNPTTTSATGITINNANAGFGGAHAIVQPTIVANKIIRII